MNNEFKTILEDNECFMKQFKRDTYSDAFKSFTEKYSDMFSAINDEYENTDAKDEYINDLTDEFINYVNEQYLSLGKNKRSNFIIDKNMLMVIYVLPAINDQKSDYAKELAETLIKKWNDTFKQKIRLGSFEDINAGFKRKLCYVTTAVCNSLGKEENCAEIKLLKNYRDTYLISEPDGRELIDTYYDIAPTIVNRINKCDDSEKIYEQIYTTYINPCIQFIENDKLNDCKELYVKMMHNLKNRYMN